MEDYYINDDEQRIKIIQSMHRATTSMNNLLANLLNWSKMQSGNIMISPKRLNLLKIIEESLGLHKELINRKKQTTEVNIDQCIYIDGDEHMVLTVFRNLISNAAKYTPEKGKITINAQESGNMVQVCVIDTGIGLSQDDINNLFDIRNIDKISGFKTNKGSGLGLLLCKEFIESHNCKLWVESDYGSGSKFYCTLPKDRSCR